MATPLPSTFATTTGDLLIDAATTGYQWNLGADRTVDWSISNGFNGEFWVAPASVQAAVQTALAVFSVYANIQFNYVGSFTTPAAAYAGGSEINVSLSGNTNFFPSSLVWGRAYFPTTIGQDYQGAAGDVYLNINSAANTLPSYEPGSAGWFLLIHELGHALGLKHPHDDGGTGHPTLTQLGLGDFEVDWATIMAYGDDYNWNLRAFDPATPMVLDVLALQALYGPNMSHNTGDNSYEIVATNTYMTYWDAAGIDEVNASTSDRGWEIYLPDEQLSSVVSTRVGYAVPTSELALASPRSLFWLTGDIEDAIGSNFADTIYGSVLSNYLYGGGGNDEIIAWHGDDTADGGAGNDSIYGGQGNDLIGDTAGGSNYLRGDEGNDQIVGGSGFDDINGNMGDDTASGGAGDDWVVGGKDNDVLLGGVGDDIAYGNIGNDSCAGEAGNDLLRGGQGNDIVLGNDGNDWASGDRGDDTMTGGAGADIFHTFGDANLDRVTDFNLAEGDRVQLDPGTTYTVAQVGADTVISMTGGGQMILVGVTLTSLTGNWIFGN
ncbi:reprolysin-like metallopeptidase [Phenylobacterium sp.]|uniref:reprolysin-like metallopeptidase n=1 Tax=Phenylobacterium sp. TaxID=1871053 RepID=UPI002FE41AF3